MSKLTQYIAILNAPDCPTEKDFAFYFDNLDKGHQNYAQARSDYRKNLFKQGIDIDRVAYKKIKVNRKKRVKTK